jgi:hypothetical protein
VSSSHLEVECYGMVCVYTNGFRRSMLVECPGNNDKSVYGIIPIQPIQMLTSPSGLRALRKQSHLMNNTSLLVPTSRRRSRPLILIIPYPHLIRILPDIRMNRLLNQLAPPTRDLQDQIIQARAPENVDVIRYNPSQHSTSQVQPHLTDKTYQYWAHPAG